MYLLPTSIRRFLKSEDGPTAVEYALLIGFLALAIIGIVDKLGTGVSGTFNTVNSTFGTF